MRWVRDRTGRFPQRPYWQPEELDAECEALLARLRRPERAGQYPVTTDELTVLLESQVDDLDLYADLSSEGDDVEGLTEFVSGARPRVKISRRLSGDQRRENRLRTTITHEFGHVTLHGFLVGFARTMTLFGTDTDDDTGQAVASCRRATIVDAPVVDWMEWQASYVSGALLMPRSQVTALVRAFTEATGEAPPFAEDSDFGRLVVDAVVDRFQVSGDAARVRLTKLRHLSRSAVAVRPLFGAPSA